MAVVKTKSDKYTVVPNAIRIGVLNLMPNKEQTEDQYRALFAMSDVQVDLVWIRQISHKSKHTEESHLEKSYLTIDEALRIGVDGMIITGAPIENLPFEEVTYWNELTPLLDSLAEQSIPTLFICWASQAALYHYYDIQKHPLSEKMFGIYPHRILEEDEILLGDVEPIYAPHSRHTLNLASEIRQVEALKIVLESDEAGAFMIVDRQFPFYYISGHMEYDLEALDREYKRDITKGLAIGLPKAYYVHNDPALGIEDTWQASAARLADRWLQSSLFIKEKGKPQRRRATAHAVV